jgi:hypothetical protein
MTQRTFFTTNGASIYGSKKISARVLTQPEARQCIRENGISRALLENCPVTPDTLAGTGQSAIDVELTR